MVVTEKQHRRSIFRALLPYYGKIVSAQFLKKTITIIPGLERIHPLIEGIYKPAGSEYALSIATMKKNPYADKLTYLPDGRWYIKYSAKFGGRDLAVNQGLFKCMFDKEPIIVLEQISNKDSRQGIQYRLMGLGIIDSYDAGSISKKHWPHAGKTLRYILICSDTIPTIPLAWEIRIFRKATLDRLIQ